jgi:threo-3-hydroxy-L-aspartate ammonia-lyase
VIEFDDVVAAARRLGGVAHRTPVVTSRTLDSLVGASLFLKAENLQRGGAFKFRGAYNKISSVDGDVAAYSSGNHAQAVALAASLLGRAAVILMPEDAPPAKVEATRGYGAEVVTYDRYTQDRDALGTALAQERGLTLVKPYDDPLVMAGQGTVGLEILEDLPDVDVVLVQVGGGGLVSGIATAIKGRKPDARVVAVEPERSRALHESLLAGKPVTVEAASLADGLNGPYAGGNCVAVCSALGVETALVSEDELKEGFRFVYGRAKLACEAAGAATSAALLAGKVELEPGDVVAAVVSGGNVAPQTAAAILAEP